MPEWLFAALAFIGGAMSTWLLLRVRFERFEAMDTRREQDWTAWRKEVDQKLATFNGGLLSRVKRIEDDIGDHDHGIRGSLHSYGGDIHYHGLCIWALANKVGLELPQRDKKR